MPLSEYEQRVLEQMERELTSDDPRLATTLQSSSSRSGLRYVIAGIGLVVGLLMLVLGVAQSVPWIGVVGFVIMFGAVTYALAQPKRTAPLPGPTGTVGPDGGVKAARTTGTKGRASRPGSSRSGTAEQGFIKRLEQRWERRRDDRG